VASEETNREMLKELRDAVVKYDEQKAVYWANRVIDKGVDPVIAIKDGLAQAMSAIGELYKAKKYGLPGVIACGDAVNAVLNLLRPHIKDEARMKGKIVIGNVEGDNHELGKKLVKIALEASGWLVYDLGVDVKAEEFAKGVQRVDADILALSAWATSNMLQIRKIIDTVRARKPKVVCMVGGPHMTRELATLYGAEGFAENFAGVDAEASRILKQAQAK